MNDVRAILPAGSIVRRKVPANDGWDLLRVVGFADFGGGQTEVVVTPATHHEAAIHVAIEALDEHYLLVEEGTWPPPAWESDPLDVALRRDPDAQRAGQEVMRVIQDDREAQRAEPSPKVKEWAKQHDPNPLEEIE